MKILGYHIQDNIIINSDGEYRNKSPYISFLMDKKPDTIRIFGNLYQSVLDLSRLLNWGDNLLKELLATSKIKFTPYKIAYKQDSFLSIKRSNYLSKMKSKLTYYGDLSKYIILDADTPLKNAIYVKDCGQQVYDMLVELGMNPINLVNPFKQYVKNKILIEDYHSLEWHLEKMEQEYNKASDVKKLVINQIMEGLKGETSK
jgi:hypothetical protein